jgi:DNA invertase Pin-like site-specific DNA recombinase
MRAAIYARVSTADQATEGTSIDTQLDSCRSYVNAKGWDLVDTFVDEGVSGGMENRRSRIEAGASLGLPLINSDLHDISRTAP